MLRAIWRTAWHKELANRGDLDAASDMLALLLDASDAGLAYDEDGLLYEGFDL